MNLKRFVIIFISIFFLQSCGLKFWYNRVDWLVSWQVDDFVDLSGAQEDALEKLVKQKLEWHRKTQLPLYIDLIDDLSQDIKANNVASRYDQYEQKFQQFFDHISQQVTDDLLQQVATLSDKQVMQLLKNLNDNANKSERKFNKTKSKKRLKEIRSNIEDGYNDWIGRLNKQQKALIKERVEQLKPTAKLYFEYSKKWRVALDFALKERQLDSGKQKIKALVLTPQTLQSPLLIEHNQYNRQLEKEYTLKLLATLSPKQKKKLLRKLKNHKEDFEDLLND